ncbi:MAG: alanyl-tRNA editing protein, partial [Thermomicrobiales bacterium]|nr:alanyl-tRNA editing protein [Thermomicrobiales bacterium]
MTHDKTTAPAPAAATDLLYHRDAYLKATEATVVAVDPESRTVALDRTIVYPGGGGQPHDTGTLTSGSGGEWPVVAAKKAGDAVWHELGGDAALPGVGDGVTVSIDWERRYRLMRIHTALHVLCGMIYRDYGALVTGGNMGTDKARMDFELEAFNPGIVAEIERRANEEIASERETRVRILPRDEAFKVPDLIRTKINLLPEGIAEIRTVEIVGL